MINFSYQIDYILHQVFKIFFEYIFEKHERFANNPSIKKYLCKTEDRITFKIKSKYYLEIFTPETMKLLGSTRDRITKDKKW